MRTISSIKSYDITLQILKLLTKLFGIIPSLKKEWLSYMVKKREEGLENRW